MLELLDYRQWDMLSEEDQIKRIKKEKLLAEKLLAEKEKVDARNINYR